MLPFSTSQIARLPFPEWGTVNMRRMSGGEDELNHTIQMGFQKRFSDRWQASATYSMTFDYQKDYPVILPEMAAFPQTRGGCTVSEGSGVKPLAPNLSGTCR